MISEANEGRPYDYIVVGTGAAGSVLAAELSASGAQVLVIESGGHDDAPTIRIQASGFTTWPARSITTCRSSLRHD
jgi:choline dehydrogenase-like flavoprotein